MTVELGCVTTVPPRYFQGERKCQHLLQISVASYPFNDADLLYHLDPASFSSLNTMQNIEGRVTGLLPRTEVAKMCKYESGEEMSLLEQQGVERFKMPLRLLMVSRASNPLSLQFARS